MPDKKMTLYYDVDRNLWTSNVGQYLRSSQLPQVTQNEVVEFEINLKRFTVQGMFVQVEDFKDMDISTPAFVGLWDKRNNGTLLAMSENFDLSELPKGIIRFSLSFFTQEIEEKLGNSESANWYLGVSFRKPDESLILQIVGQIQVIADIENPGSPPPVPFIGYTPDLTAETPDGQYVRQMLGGVRSWVKGVLSVAFTPCLLYTNGFVCFALYSTFSSLP